MARLSRAEQDAILDVVATAYLHVSAECNLLGPDESTSENEVPKFRAALRLDDKRLDHAIAWGAHKQPWSSAVPAKMDA